MHGTGMLPPAPVGSWLRPLPSNAAAAFVPLQISQPINPVPQLTWSLVIPKNLMFYRMPSSTVIGNPYIPNALPALQDCSIALQEYQRDINVIL
jgi:hypothetical protein